MLPLQSSSLLLFPCTAVVAMGKPKERRVASSGDAATKKEKALSDQDILIQIRDLLAEGRSDGVKTTSDGITGNTKPDTTTT